jgi:LacI family transcriptional regulator
MLASLQMIALTLPYRLDPGIGPGQPGQTMISQPSPPKARQTVSATINDVARVAEVSIKTVSRVINREPKVAQLTRARVEAAIVALEYRPSIPARQLAGARTYMISLLFDGPGSSYIQQLQLGAIRQCQRHGYHLTIEAVDLASPTLEDDLKRILGTSRSDGYIVAPPVSDDVSVLKVLEGAGVSYTRIDPKVGYGSSPSVTIDDERAADQITSYLAALGHRRIALVKGPPGHGSSELRLRGYRSALKAAGIAYDVELVVQGEFTTRSGAEAAERLLGLADRPTAIFAGNDDMALGVILSANRQGLRVPKDLSVCGFDDSPLAMQLDPSLTTIRQPVAEMAAHAADMLIFPDEKRRSPANFDFTLVVRESTGPVSALGLV